MKTFNSLEEMQPYYNENCNEYIFEENHYRIDIHINFILKTTKNINAGNIVALDITAKNINAWDIKSMDINASNIDAWNINADNIKSKDINADYINANNIKSRNIDVIKDIDVMDINARNIDARNIDANNINAKNIEFFAVCFAYKTFICDSVKGRRENSRYFCLDSDVVINKKED